MIRNVKFISLRNDYVEGTSPVPYIEGFYVKSEFRNKSVAKKLDLKRQIELFVLR